MRAADTNVLVRLIARDDEKQIAAAQAFVEGGVWVSQVVLVETVWVLGSSYRRDRRGIAEAVEMLLRNEQVTFEDADTVIAALERYRDHSSIEFTDCLILEIARKAGHLPLGTFDRDLAKLEGVERV